MKLAFCTDIHLNHLKPAAAREFLVSIAAAKPDAIVSCGDMSEAPDLSTHLGWAAQILDGVPFYYVLGNHDFYRGSIRVVRASLLGTAKGQRYLTQAGPAPLTDSATLIGDDGWYDGEYGNWERSIEMTDYYAITEFRGQSQIARKTIIEELAGDSARRITEKSVCAIECGTRHLIIATHVPPFRACSRGPSGKESDAHWLPVMSSKRVGSAIQALADQYPKVRFTVLCGHTHTPCDLLIQPNLRCVVGNADATGKSGYGYPMFTMMEIE